MKLKYFFIFVLALTAALATTSCTDTDSIAGGAEGDSAMRTFTFNVTTGDGGAQTRAAAAPVVTGYDMQYILQVLDAEGRTLDLGSGVTQQTNTNGQFAVKLPVGKVYTCLFWAQYVPTGTATSDFFTTTDLQEVTLKQPLTSGDESQAFSATAEIPAAPTEANVEVVLKRAVAQVNLKSGVQMLNYSKVKATYTQVPDRFNVKTGAITLSGGNNTATFEATDFTAAADASGKYPFHSAYVLAQGDGNANMLTAQLEIFNTASTTVAIQTVNISDVPTKRNYRTNIVNTFNSATTAHTYMLDYEEWEGIKEMTPPSLWNGNVPSGKPAGSAFSGGTGVDEDNAWRISSAADLAQLAADVNAGCTYEHKFFKLTVDIDLDNKDWTPIGSSYSNQFKGKFDGQQHKITGLYINNSEKYVGLFGSTRNENYGEGYIKNLHVSGSVTTTNTEQNASAGGICGDSFNQDIRNCSFSGSVNAVGAAGGITGYGDFGRIIACKNSGNIKGAEAGGIAGKQVSALVEGCYNEGTIEGDTYIGGISGYVSDFGAGINACYNIGEVKTTAPSTSIIAGIGDYYNSGNITSCFVVQTYANSTAGETEFSSNGGGWPTSVSGTAWYADASNNGTDNKYWKSLGEFDAVNPVYPKLWWEN